MTELPAGDELPSTAYAVLGILSINKEMLTVGEIKKRASLGLRFFYWSPAVSHIRRELRRLLALKLVEEREISIGRVRRAQVYQATDEGEKWLARWVSATDSHESVVVKNPVLLRVFLGSKVPHEDVLAVLDARLQKVGEDIADLLWGRRRAAELGLDAQEQRKFSIAVTDYTLRGLYFEQSNLQQLRDTVVGFDTEAFKHDARQPRGALRPRPDDT